MALTAKTHSGASYTYLRYSNEIVAGEQNEEIEPLLFNDRLPISSFPDLDTFTLGITTKCNLRCSYCCYSGSYRNTRAHGSHSMSGKEILPVINFIKQYAAKASVTISFYGGESLLEFDLLRAIVRQARHEWQGRVQFEITTNGTLLTGEAITWLVENDFTLFVSLDGTMRVQDRQRATASGIGSFKPVIEALAHIKTRHPGYFREKVNIMMTVVDISEIPLIAKEWHDHELLRDKLPARIATVAPNYAKGVSKVDVTEETNTHLRILDVYTRHPEYTMLGVFFERLLAEWQERPICDLDIPSDFPTCVPNNRKVYIDHDGEVGICEKVPDKYRIGDIRNGIDWERVNRQADALSRIILSRCTTCPIARLCSICPNALDLSAEELDVFCHNERAMQQVKFRIFCEMAEREMLSNTFVPTLKSEHCMLDKIEENDIAALGTIFSDVDTQRYLPELYEIANAKDGVKKILKSFHSYLLNKEGFLWGIRKYDTFLIGFIAIMDLPYNPTIFFAMHPMYRNQGYMQESVSLATQYICDAKLCTELHTEVDVENIASRNVLEHCGYKVKEREKDKYLFSYQSDYEELQSSGLNG